MSSKLAMARRILTRKSAELAAEPEGFWRDRLKRDVAFWTKRVAELEAQ